jgi:hypothetical protein
LDQRCDLPSIARFKLQPWDCSRGSDLYGALHTAARYIGMKIPFNVRNLMWQHGCIPPWQQVAPEPVTYAAPKDWTMLVARADELNYLQLNGYTDVHCIGLPFIYTLPRMIERRKRSLLVMPVHFLKGAQGIVGLERYANEIAMFRHHFDLVAVCIYASDINNRNWVDEFSRQGLPIISGAADDDRNALSRIRALMNSFEYVTTNGWGSHCAYALYCGAKLSIWGTEIALTKERWMLDSTWSANPAAIDLYLSADTEAKKALWLKRFMTYPQEGVADEALGAWLIGEDQKLSPKALKDRLGWSARKRLARFANRGLSLLARLSRW